MITKTQKMMETVQVQKVMALALTKCTMTIQRGQSIPNQIWQDKGKTYLMKKIVAGRDRGEVTSIIEA